MAEMVEFASNGSTARGYLARPDGGTGPGVLVVQEWWGLDSGIKEMADRLAAGGFTALCPDLFHGDLASHQEPDQAAALMTAMPPDRAARDMSGAIDFLLADAGATGDGVGVVGFCMGGMLAWLIAANRPDAVRAVVPFYGYPSGDMEPDWSRLDAPVRAHMAEHDDFFGPEGATRARGEAPGPGQGRRRSPCTRAPATRSWRRTTRSARATRPRPPRSGPACSTFLHAQLD